MLSRILDKVMAWALARNGHGGYPGEESPRWAYTITDDATGEPYLSRVLLPRVKLPLVGEFRVMLHHFHRADADRALHNHPWRWAGSLVLCGSYVEDRLDADIAAIVSSSWFRTLRAKLDLEPVIDAVTRKRVRWVNWLTDQDFHRVDRLEGDVWTLFIAGPRTQDWGFVEAGTFIPWQKFLADKRAQRAQKAL